MLKISGVWPEGFVRFQPPNRVGIQPPTNQACLFILGGAPRAYVVYHEIGRLRLDRIPLRAERVRGTDEEDALGWRFEKKTEANPTYLRSLLSMRSIQNEQGKPIANISLSFNSLGCLGGSIHGKNKRIEVAYAQH